MENTIVETPSSESPIVIELPPGSAHWVIGGFSVALIWMSIQKLAGLYLRLIPVGRRLFPRLFRSQWDEWIEETARLLVSIEPRFKDYPAQEIGQMLKNPGTTARLIASPNPVEEMGMITKESAEKRPQG